MSYATAPRYLSWKNLLHEKHTGTPSIVLHIDQSGVVSAPKNEFTYRTEAYLRQREQQNEHPPPPPPTTTTITTWKTLMHQRRALDHDQAEIDRALAMMESIHGTFNRSLSLPYNEVYASLYGDDDRSARLLKTFCQRQDHYIKDEEACHTQETSSSFGLFPTSDSDSDASEDEAEKKKSYDSGYGSVVRHLPRDSPLAVVSLSPAARNFSSVN